MARLHIGHIVHLGVGDVQQLTQLLPVGGRLIEQHQKLRVCKHQPRRLRIQTLLHVLGGSGQDAAVFPEPLPRLIQHLGGIVVLEIKVG